MDLAIDWAGLISPKESLRISTHGCHLYFLRLGPGWTYAYPLPGTIPGWPVGAIPADDLAYGNKYM